MFLDEEKNWKENETVQQLKMDNKKLRKEMLALKRAQCSDEADNIMFTEMNHADLDRVMGCVTAPSIVVDTVVSKQGKFIFCF
jgi:hypothetical protein